MILKICEKTLKGYPSMLSNSSPLIIFGRLNKFDILKKLFNKIEITKSVYDEVVERGMKANKSDSFIVKDLVDEGFISVESLSSLGHNKSLTLRNTYLTLDEGESDTIALAIQKNQKYLLIDEKSARNVAELYGLFPIGTLGIFLLGYRKNILNEKEINAIVDKLVLDEFRIGADVLQEFWKLFDVVRKLRK